MSLERKYNSDKMCNSYTIFCIDAYYNLTVSPISFFIWNEVWMMRSKISRGSPGLHTLMCILLQAEFSTTCGCFSYRAPFPLLQFKWGTKPRTQRKCFYFLGASFPASCITKSDRPGVRRPVPGKTGKFTGGGVLCGLLKPFLNISLILKILPSFVLLGSG